MSAKTAPYWIPPEVRLGLWIFFIAAIAGIWYFNSDAYDLRMKRHDTKSRVQDEVVGLYWKKIGSGKFNRTNGIAYSEKTYDGVDMRFVALPKKDAWGQSLFAVYEREGDWETVTVLSWGPDGEFDTADDISDSRKTGYRKALLADLKNTGKQWSAEACACIRDLLKKPDKTLLATTQ